MENTRLNWVLLRGEKQRSVGCKGVNHSPEEYLAEDKIIFMFFPGMDIILTMITSLVTTIK